LNPLDQHRERRQRHGAARLAQRRPDEAALLQALCNSARNAGLSAASAQLVRITHPFHPFAGRQLACVGERYNRLVADMLEGEWNDKLRDPNLPNRERLLAYLIEDVTLIKLPAEQNPCSLQGGKTETLTTQNPKSSAQQVKTDPKVVELVDTLLDNHIYPEIADILNEAESVPAVQHIGDRPTLGSPPCALLISPTNTGSVPATTGCEAGEC
jgi:hypothetical protein